MASSRKTNLLIAFVCLLASVSAHGDDWACDHDDLDYKAHSLEVDEDMSSLSGDRRLGSEDYPNLRMVPNYDFLATAPSSFRAYVKNELIPPVLSFLSNALRVKYPIQGLLAFDSSYVCEMPTPRELRYGVEADYYIMFDSRAEDSNVVASSRACQLAASTRRPIIAYSNFNRVMLQEARGDILLHEKNMYLVIHEIMHTLGISKNSYGDYLDEFGNKRQGHLKSMVLGGQTHIVIDVPSLTSRIQKFYGCPSMVGAVMENDGGSGTALSHFERKFFLYEVMASGGIFGRRVSEFSLALLEGSGWYVPDYSYAEPFFFGQGEGCTFLTQRCLNNYAFFDEFCLGSDQGCAPQGRSGGRCTTDDRSEGCRYVDPMPEFDCENPDAVDYARLPDLQTFGRDAGSKCFTGTLSNRASSAGAGSFCFNYECQGEGVNTILTVKVGGNRVTCAQKGQQGVPGYYGGINCPDPIQFCNTIGRKYCPRNCMGRGNCVDNVCQCNEGFTGVDCGLYE